MTIESGPDEGLDACGREARLLHPSAAIGAGVVEAARRLDEHVQAHHQTERVLRSVIVDDRLVHDERAAVGHCVERFANEHPLGRQIPVVQDVAHHDDVGLRQLLLKEVAGNEREAIGDAERRDVLLEDRRHSGKVEADAAEMRIRQRDLHGEIALRGADVDERLVVLSTGTSRAIARFAPRLRPVIAPRNCFKTRRIGIERLEETRTAGLDFVLRQSRYAGLGEIAPERIEALVAHLENAADIRRLFAIEEEIGLRGIGVAIARRA